MPAPRALIAEDEPLLAQALQASLKKLWPELVCLPHAMDGDEAVELALRDLPQVLFLDIRMPGRTGLEAAQAIVEDWPNGQNLPLIVFVTAYDHYALQAFEANAVDYVLKPAQPNRLAATCERLKARLAQIQGAGDAAKARPEGSDASSAQHSSASGALSSAAPAACSLSVLPADQSPHQSGHTLNEQLLDQLRQLLSAAPGLGSNSSSSPQPNSGPLRVIQAQVGHVVHMVPIDDVIYFEAADKYIRVLTAEREYLIRCALKELQAQLDDSVFWQVHRGTVVRATAIVRAERDEAGRLSLHLRQRPERLAVSRIYAPRFRGM